MRARHRTFLRLAITALALAAPLRAQDSTAIRLADFVFTRAPFASAHASTIAETGHDLLAAWFGGSREGADDVGIWLARYADSRWSAPRQIATGEEGGRRYPCWNPVLVPLPDGTLRLYYRVGPSPTRWWGMVRVSRDDGRTWGAPERLPDGILGPIRNRPVLLGHGIVVSPSSTETPDSANRWRVHFEWSGDLGRTWTRATPAPDPSGRELDAIQPAILRHAEGALQALGRTRAGRVFETWSRDSGRLWSPLTLTALPNPNSGIDAVTLHDGRHLIVYNHAAHGRTPLNVAVSRDGRVWEAALVLESEPGEYSYPSVVATRDGLVHVTYTWRRERIRHVVIDPARLRAVPMPDGVWPAPGGRR